MTRRPFEVHSVRLRCLLSAAVAAVAAVCLVACGAAPASLTPPPAATSWERLDPVPDSRDGPARLFDAGGLLIGPGTGGPWISPDGRSWTKGKVEGPAGASVSAVAAGPEGGPAFVGVGRVAGEAGDRPMAFTSSDGRGWAAVDSQPAFDLAPGHEQASLELIATGPTGIVAAGTEWGTAGQRPFVLVSTDGQRWERTSEPLVGSGPRALAATDSGFVLAGAGNAPAGQMTHTAFWTSADGRSWQPAPDIAVFANAEPRALAAGHGTIVAVGYRILTFSDGDLEGGFAPAAWTSTDGRAWAAAAETPGLAWWPAGRPTPAPGAIEGTVMEAVASLPDGFVAVGVRWGINPAAPPASGEEARITGQGVAWRSPDGAAWQMLPDDPVLPLGTSEGGVGAGMYSVVARGDQVIAAGGTEAEGVFIYLGTPEAGPVP